MRYLVTVRETWTFGVAVYANNPAEAREVAEALLAQEELDNVKREPDAIDCDMEDWDVDEIAA